jgi:hypothetical protein
LRNSKPGQQLNGNLDEPGDVVFRHACMISSLGSRYRSGRSPDWLKFKNPEAPAARAGFFILSQFGDLRG